MKIRYFLFSFSWVFLLIYWPTASFAQWEDVCVCADGTHARQGCNVPADCEAFCAPHGGFGSVYTVENCANKVCVCSDGEHYRSGCDVAEGQCGNYCGSGGLGFVDEYYSFNDCDVDPIGQCPIGQCYTDCDCPDGRICTDGQCVQQCRMELSVDNPVLRAGDTLRFRVLLKHYHPSLTTPFMIWLVGEDGNKIATKVFPLETLPAGYTQLIRLSLEIPPELPLGQYHLHVARKEARIAHQSTPVWIVTELPFSQDQ